MSDPLATSKSARESLARGLNALQADNTVPAHLIDLAAPIAQAMGALHQLEKTRELAPHAEVALNHLRGALSRLQASPTQHPAVGAALLAVASSLNQVHTLAAMAGKGSAPHQAAAPPAQQPPMQAPPAQAAPQGGPVRTANMPQRPPSAPHQHAAHVMQPPQQAAPPPQAMAPQIARDPFAAPPPQAAAPVPTGPKPATPSMPVPAPPPQSNVQVINADLGTHSPTNFFKGLSGNDIIDHGGLFVSTYVSPKIGTPVRLKVSLPGGYEFEANAVVKWTREQGGDAPPGFGARFTQITPEARQLVYRYVRNREPLFYDDL